jgi:GalNAc-alpha-(1->4)-GalNAc-alpha-(1->3)-diNAcBac-PP-undecaprenol alpha-1,4-N-acetyl-D-galactosaminyltransferase
LNGVQPDVVLAFGDTTNVKTLLAAGLHRIPAVVSERVDPSTVDIGREWSLLRRFAYPRAAAVVVQTERVRAWAERIVAADRVHVIGNPVEIDERSPTLVREPEIVAIGRLVAQKGFDVLLRAFACVAARHPSWRLVILGEGPLRAELHALAMQLAIVDRVELAGQVHDVRTRLRRAGLYVSSSRFEGFPNALVEAMAEGTAIVATDCPSGPAEILRDCPEAPLVPVADEAALADALAEMLADPERRRVCGSSARRCVARYTLPAVVDVWESLLVRAAARRPRDA